MNGEGNLRHSVSLSGRLQQPVIRQWIVHGYITATTVEVAEDVLGVDPALIGSAGIPMQCGW
ncbi:hypothetical protein D3C85_1828520 [compost metagenome]